ncbi:methionine/alanine import family NSS transporter small subunit [Rhodococcus marinonascens]|nr:methionine/alanine import family NSS transporter small subunit [Rhodococcus marinonascens]
MSISGIVMMVVTLTLVWGGLVASLVHLHHHPDDEA